MGAGLVNTPAGTADGNHLTLKNEVGGFDRALQGNTLTGTFTGWQEGSEKTVDKISLTKEPRMPHSGGIWVGARILPGGGGDSIVLELDQQDKVVGGTFILEGVHRYSLGDGAIDGNRITFNVAMPDLSYRSHFELTRDGDELNGEETIVTDAHVKRVVKITAIKRFD
jgi:hypothetical protein